MWQSFQEEKEQGINEELSCLHFKFWLREQIRHYDEKLLDIRGQL